MIELATRKNLTADHIQIIRTEGLAFYNPQVTRWESISQRVMEIERTNFPNLPDSEETLRRNFLNPVNVVATITDPRAMQLAGYTIITPAENEYREQTSEDKKRLYPKRLTRPGINFEIIGFVNVTSLSEEYQGYGLVKDLNAMVLIHLWELGYRIIERDATHKKRYAHNLMNAYHDQILFHETHDSIHGLQEFISMTIKDPAATSAGIS